MAKMRTREELDSEVQCSRCAGSGIAEHPLRYGPTTCSLCWGSGLVRPPKFRVVCECGQKQPRYASNFTAQKWMHAHLRSHAPEEAEDFGEAAVGGGR